MKRINSVISLACSLSKSEKKHFFLQVVKEHKDKDYLVIYDIIIKNKIYDGEEVKKEFHRQRPDGSFEISLHYLYEKMLDSLLLLRKKRDNYYDLQQNISKARMLYERSLFHECFELLDVTIKQANIYEYYEIIMIATKLELEYLLRLNFPDISEQELYHKHFARNEALKNIRKITEQNSLFNLLKYRLSHKGFIRTAKEKQDMNDLIVQELHIAASSDSEHNFEITKNHKLFQASYLISIGEYRTALNIFKELSNLFEENPHFWANPPIYYLYVLEGVLDSLRSVGDYDDIPYFLNKLEKLAMNSSFEFRVNTSCVLFQYELFQYLDRGDFSRCNKIIEKYQDSLFDKESWLSPMRQSELLLYTAIVFIGNRNYKMAMRYINRMILNHNIDYIPLMRTMRLVRLIAYYEIGEFDLISYETRSIKRELLMKKEKSFQTEHIILGFLNKRNLPILRKDREAMYKKLLPTIKALQEDKYENQLLRIFDFTAWIESKILRIDLADTLIAHAEARSQKFR
ncbi:MAG: hypothetical protein LBG96_14280 [Tannerella sp.]|jgi:hypothetical protein|nr:hypothetical protein [Tannerella sp.]